jgi:hypothetical protein
MLSLSKCPNELALRFLVNLSSVCEWRHNEVDKVSSHVTHLITCEVIHLSFITFSEPDSCTVEFDHTSLCWEMNVNERPLPT